MLKLKQILINLVDNAIKFTPEGTVQITVFLQSHNQDSIEIGFEVKDSGLGIREDELFKLFEPFYQTETGINLGVGSGLGLTICKSFVQLMGGDLQVKSQLNYGTSFYFSIPVQKSLDTSFIQSLSPEITGFNFTESSRNHILIIEDIEKNSLLLEKILSPLGFKLSFAIDGEEGFNSYLKYNPDLILMDIHLPKKNGLEITQEIRQNKHLPQPIIIALSASAFESQKINAIESGCDDFLSKPLSKNILLETIAKYLKLQPIYKEIREEKSTIQLTEDSLKFMPLEWRENLLLAAKQLNGKKIMELITLIPPEKESLIFQLKTMIKEYDFDRIINIIKLGNSNDSGVGRLGDA